MTPQSTKPQEQPAGSKKPYEKPRLRAIKLFADEVLAEGCKTDPGATGFGGELCTSGYCSSTPGS